MTIREMRKNTMIKCAIIGCGRIASEFEFILDTLKPHSHAGSYDKYPKSKICLGVDSNPDKATSFSDSWSVPCYDSMEKIPADMLGKNGIECVSVCTPPPSHLSVISDCIKKFKGLKVIWCEKPLGSSLEDVVEIRNRCKDAGIKLCVNTWRRWDPIHLKIENLIKSGKIGKIQSVYAQAHVGLSNTGIHLFDLINQYTGSKPISVFGKIIEDGSIDPGATGVIEYDLGFSVFIDNLWKKEQRLGMIIQGESGRIEAFADKTLLESFTLFYRWKFRNNLQSLRRVSNVQSYRRHRD